VGFVVDIVALGQVFSEYFGSLHSTHFSTLTLTYHPELVQYASSGRSTQSLTAQITKKREAHRLRVFENSIHHLLNDE
jgi:hypothetical protein